MRKKKLIKVYLCINCVIPISCHSGLYGQGRCKPCAMKGNKNNPASKGGKIKDSSGHILILSHKHPNKCTGNYVYGHRLVMEKKLGRYLKSTEIVHHINGIKDDNRIKNLALMTKEKHTKIHVKKRTTYLQLAQQRIQELEKQLNEK